MMGSEFMAMGVRTYLKLFYEFDAKMTMLLPSSGLSALNFHKITLTFQPNYVEK